MSKDNLQKMYLVVNDIRTGDDATRKNAYTEVRAAYIALLKDASVDFSQLPAYDLDVMKHYALRSYENTAVELAIKGVSGIIGTTQAAKETVQFMANPVAMAKSAAQLVTHPGDVVNQVESAIINPWDTFKGNTMPQRLALAQQLESANSEFDLQTGQAKETAQSTINVLTTVAGAAGFVGKIPKIPFPPAGSVAVTAEGFALPVVDAVAPAKIGTVPVAGVMAMTGGSGHHDGEQPNPANPHASISEREGVMMSEELIQRANAYLKAIEYAKANPHTQEQLKISASAYKEYVNDNMPISPNTGESRPYGTSLAEIQKQVIIEKALLVMVDASEGASVKHTAKLQMHVDGLDSNLELAIVE